MVTNEAVLAKEETVEESAPKKEGVMEKNT
jgi:hypothetical protein